MSKFLLPLPLLVLMTCLPVLVSCERQQDEEQVVSGKLAADARCDREPGCAVVADGFTATILIGPGAQALEPFPVHVRLHDSAPVTGISADFVMDGMAMGSNRYRLVRNSDGSWHGRVTLPLCIAGRSDWVAEFELLINGRRIHIDAPFELEK